MPGQVLSARALNRALLARQLLLARSPLGAAAAIEHLVGMQAQQPAPPYFGLWARLAGFRAEELSDLYLRREVVRIALMRSTLHLVSSADCLTLRPALQSAVSRGVTAGSAFGRALAGIDRGELARVGRELVEREPATAGEIGASLQQRWPGADPVALAAAVRSAVPLVQVPPRGLWGRTAPPRCTSAELWLGRPLGEPDLAQMVRRYLTAYGPASVADAQAWSGSSGLRPVFESLRADLSTFRSEGGAELFDLPDAPRPEATTPVPVRLLPDFDNILLSHVDRSRIFASAHKPLIFTSNGIIRATVLLDGFVAGTWQLVTAGGTARVTVRLLPGSPPISARQQAGIEQEAVRLVGLAAPEAVPEVRIADPAANGPR